MSAHVYCEDQPVEQPAIGLFVAPGWQLAGTRLKAAAAVKNAGVSQSTASGRPAPGNARNPAARPAGSRPGAARKTRNPR